MITQFIHALADASRVLRPGRFKMAWPLVAAGFAAAVAAGAPLAAERGTSVSGMTFRWDIVSIDFAQNPPVAGSGGHASAFADDGSKLTATGTGTFGRNQTRGGGTWSAVDPSGRVTASGTYRVTRLLRFVGAPGTTAAVDRVAPEMKMHSGLAKLLVRYSDGSGGVLTVSNCMPLPTCGPRYQGITASKGIVDYWRHGTTRVGVDENFTIFHTMP
jgi:hypothetical protein